MTKDLLLILVIAILAFFLVRQCSGGPGDPVEVIKTDTIREFVPGDPDTVYLESIEVVYLEREPDTVIQVNDSVSDFKTVYSDSLLDAEVLTRAKGEVLFTNFSYTPKFPKYITRVDTFREEVNTTLVKKRWALYAGGIIGGNSSNFTFQPALLLKTKKDLVFSAGYEVVNKTYNFGVFTKIKGRR